MRINSDAVLHGWYNDICFFPIFSWKPWGMLALRCTTVVAAKAFTCFANEWRGINWVSSKISWQPKFTGGGTQFAKFIQQRFGRTIYLCVRRMRTACWWNGYSTVNIYIYLYAKIMYIYNDNNHQDQDACLLITTASASNFPYLMDYIMEPTKMVKLLLLWFLRRK